MGVVRPTSGFVLFVIKISCNLGLSDKKRAHFYRRTHDSFSLQAGWSKDSCATIKVSRFFLFFFSEVLRIILGALKKIKKQNITDSKGKIPSGLGIQRESTCFFSPDYFRRFLVKEGPVIQKPFQAKSDSLYRSTCQCRSQNPVNMRMIGIALTHMTSVRGRGWHGHFVFYRRRAVSVSEARIDQ